VWFEIKMCAFKEMSKGFVCKSAILIFMPSFDDKRASRNKWKNKLIYFFI